MMKAWLLLLHPAWLQVEPWSPDTPNLARLACGDCALWGVAAPLFCVCVAPGTMATLFGVPQYSCSTNDIPGSVIPLHSMSGYMG